MTPALMDADAVIRLLGLEAHPEGGYFSETFRDCRTDAEDRAASTAIYFLLKEGQISRWHRVALEARLRHDATETWHWYAGAPLALSIAAPEVLAQTLRLGPDLAAGERPQLIVPAYTWQQAQSLGAYTLAGCTVAPGFTFAGFEMAPEDFRPG